MQRMSMLREVNMENGIMEDGGSILTPSINHIFLNLYRMVFYLGLPTKIGGGIHSMSESRVEKGINME